MITFATYLRTTSRRPTIAIEPLTVVTTIPIGSRYVDHDMFHWWFIVVTFPTARGFDVLKFEINFSGTVWNNDSRDDRCEFREFTVNSRF